MSNYRINRRKFLKYTGCGAMSSTTMLSSILNLRALNASAISNSSINGPDDYKALICLSLDGGNDSFNMLIPTSNDEYNDYKKVRGNLAIEKNQSLGLHGNTNGRTFSIHPSLQNLRELYNDGKAAFIANIGTLTEPLTVDDFFLERKKIPLGLLSHQDQMQQWQTGITQDRSGIGWGGRLADMINDVSPPYNSNDKISLGISLAGTNVFQSGNTSTPYSINPEEGPIGFIGYNDFPLLKETVDNLIDKNYHDIYKKTYINGLKKSRDAFTSYSDAIKNVTIATKFPNSSESDIGSSFYQIARTIAARHELGFKRQTFFVNIGGWDHHDELINNQERGLAEVDAAIKSFQEAMNELGTEDCVVTFAISDFARTLGSNGNGTDHAWGGNVFAVGGPVKGKKIYGEYPSTLDFNENVVDLGGGILVPTTSADEYFAELALWFGVPKSDLGDIFPNLINFYDYRNSGNNSPLDFLTIA